MKKWIQMQVIFATYKQEIKWQYLLKIQLDSMFLNPYIYRFIILK